MKRIVLDTSETGEEILGFELPEADLVVAPVAQQFKNDSDVTMWMDRGHESQKNRRREVVNVGKVRGAVWDAQREKYLYVLYDCIGPNEVDAAWEYELTKAEPEDRKAIIQ